MDAMLCKSLCVGQDVGSVMLLSAVGQEYKDAYHTIGLFRKEMCNLVTEVSP
jgi:hypothetical protein